MTNNRNAFLRIMPLVFGLILAGLLVLSLPSQVAAQFITRYRGQPEKPAAPVVSDLELLKKAGVKDDNDGYLAYIKSVTATPETKKAVDELIAKLGDPEWKVRETATEKLALMSIVAQEALSKAASEGDAEIQSRAKEILDRSDSTKVLSVVLSRIAANKMPGAAKPLLAILPQCGSNNLQWAVWQAISATATTEDLPTLRDIAKIGLKTDRLMAFDVVIKLPNVKPLDEIKPFVNDHDEQMVLRAARVLAVNAERDCLDILVRLMASDDATIRAESHALLQAVTKKKFVFVAYDSLADRDKAIGEIKKWVATDGKTAKLSPATDVKVLFGRTLMCLATEKRVLELDKDGKVTFELKNLNATPWDCQGLPDGHRLISFKDGMEVIEYDETGKECWKMTGLDNPQSAQRLPNGNTIITLSPSNKIIEVNSKKETVWQAEISGSPTYAVRLDNGNTLIALQTIAKIIEIDSKGKEIWSINNLRSVRSAVRLANGNTLVALTGESMVVEFDNAGKRIWESPKYDSPKHAQRLPNGNTLITDSQGVREEDAQGKTVWENLCGYVAVAHRY